MGHEAKLSDAAQWRWVGDEVVLLDVPHSRYLGVNRTGAVLWPLLSEGTDRGRLVEALMTKYDIDEGTALTDATAFLDELGRRGLLEHGA